MTLPRPEPHATASAARDFRTTHWSVVRLAGQSESPQSAAALERLCRSYWYPLYAFVRRRGYDADTAQDLTQGFFEKLLEKNYLGAADAARGRFRTFLLTSLNRFLANEWDKSQRHKRGGGCTFLSLDDEATAEARYRAEPVSPATPESVFDQRWAQAVLEVVFARLRQEWAGAEAAARFEHLKGFLLPGEGTCSYPESAARLGLTEVAVRSAVSRLRQRFRALMREEIAHTVSSVSEIDEEIRYLFEALR